MPWQQAGITQDDLLQAMERCDRLGLEAFRQACHPGFKPAKGKRVTYQGRGPYEPRPLMAAAYARRHPDAPALGPKAFRGDSARQALMRHYGFTLEGAIEVHASKPVPVQAPAKPAHAAPAVTPPGERTRAMRAALKETDARIERLQQQLAIAHTARAVYARALSEALPPPLSRPRKPAKA